MDQENWEERFMTEMGRPRPSSTRSTSEEKETPVRQVHKVESEAPETKTSEFRRASGRLVERKSELQLRKEKIAHLKLSIQSIEERFATYLVYVEQRIQDIKTRKRGPENLPPTIREDRIPIKLFVTRIIEEELRRFTKGEVHDYLSILQGLIDNIMDITSFEQELKLIEDCQTLITALKKDIQAQESITRAVEYRKEHPTLH